VDKKQDDLARAALERHKSYQQMAESFDQQIADQRAQVETLKSALQKLEQKLAEAQAKSEVLTAQHRRSRAAGKAADAQIAIGDGSRAAAFERMKTKVARTEAVSQAKSEIASEDIEDRFRKLEHEDEIERLLAEIKTRRGA